MIKSELNESLSEEIEALEAILSEDAELNLKMEGSNLQVSTRITPLTASDASRQYVGLHLRILVDKHLYPDEQIPCLVELYKVRGGWSDVL